MCLQTQFLLQGVVQWDVISGLVFFATLFLYAAHRIVGISELHEHFQVERYGVISTFKHHIRIYAAIGLIGAGYCFLFVNWNVQMALIIPGIISLAYVIPFFGKNKRLRDLDHIKIYLIALVWGWVTVTLPALEYQRNLNWNLALMMLERTLFVFAITLPFDIRDLKVDAHSKVKTIPGILGVRKTRWLAFLVLAFSACIAGFLYLDQWYSRNTLIALLISYISTYFFIHIADYKKHDYFYTGLMDGTMLIQFLLVWGMGV